MRKIVLLTVIIAFSVGITTDASSGYKPPFKIAKGLFGNFSHRFRFVSWDRAVSLYSYPPNSTTFTRHRTSFELTYKPVKQASLHARMTNEFRYYFQPQGRDFTLNELFLDNLYLKFLDLFKAKLRLTIGRQNLKYGNGFIVMDASPLDGSRSGYFNAISFHWLIFPGNTLDGFAAITEETDEYLPRIHDQEVALVEKPERGFAVEYRRAWNKNVVSGAYIAQKEVCFDCVETDQSSIKTIGARLQGNVGGDLSGVVEMAIQSGDRGGQDRSAFGGYGQISYSTQFGNDWTSVVNWKGGVIYLSGDDPTTSKYEGWDPMFGRWPQWSESYIYTLIQENGVAWWTNLISLNISAKVPTGTNGDITLTYHRLMAHERPAFGFFPGGSGKTRGDLFITKFWFKIDDHIDGHLLWEHFRPGDFYFDGATFYNWLRMELSFTR